MTMTISIMNPVYTYSIVLRHQGGSSVYAEWPVREYSWTCRPCGGVILAIEMFGFFRSKVNCKLPDFVKVLLNIKTSEVSPPSDENFVENKEFNCRNFDRNVYFVVVRCHYGYRNSSTIDYVVATMLLRLCCCDVERWKYSRWGRKYHERTQATMLGEYYLKVCTYKVFMTEKSVGQSMVMWFVMLTRVKYKKIVKVQRLPRICSAHNKKG